MVDLASHRPCVTDLLIYSPTGHSRGAEPKYAPPGVWHPSIGSSDVKRGSKNRYSLQFRVLEIEFLDSKLDFTL